MVLHIISNQYFLHQFSSFCITLTYSLQNRRSRIIVHLFIDDLLVAINRQIPVIFDELLHRYKKALTLPVAVIPYPAAVHEPVRSGGLAPVFPTQPAIGMVGFPEKIALEIPVMIEELRQLERLMRSGKFCHFHR